MFTKTKKRTTKKSTGSRSAKTKSRILVGGKRSKPVFYKRWQFYAVGLVFGALGVAFLVLTKATTVPVNCKSLAYSGSTVKFCVTPMPTYGALRATAEYVAANTSSVMKTGNLSLEICSPQTLICTPTDTSSEVRLYTTSQPRYQHLYTHGVRLLRGAVYRTCFSMSTQAGWNLKNACTPLLTYGDNVSNAPTAYTATAQTSAANPTTTTTTDPNCNSGPLKKPDGSYYQCTFNEEFNGASLDTTKWSPLTAAAAGIGQGQDCFVDSPNNISVSGGTLNLTSRKEAAPFTCYGRKIAPTRPSQVTSGNVTTARKFSQQYGRIEIRVKVPNPKTKTPGLMQSFWLWPDKPYDQDPGNAPWPATGEIDIVETFSGNPDRAIPYVHYLPDPADPNVTNPYCYIDVTQYHTYVLTWTQDTIQVDIDGYTCVLDRPKPKSPQANPQPFNKPFYINLSAGLGVAGSTNDYVDGTTPLPATAQVDYVRVWK
jgi:beta-glucanase (GH16 family)